MNGASHRLKSAYRLTASLLLCSVFCRGEMARAQTGGAGQSRPPGQTSGKGKARANSAKAESNGKTTAGQTGKEVAGVQKKARTEPSEAYKESVRQTVERRRMRRARKQAQAGAAAAVGGIVPWPMPPALVIRHTRDVHEDIGAFLFGLRY